MAGCRFLVESAFQMLAEDKLQSNVWRSYCDYANGNVKAIFEQVLDECSSQARWATRRLMSK